MLKHSMKDRSHTMSFIDWKWNVGQAETNKWLNNNCEIMMAESSQPKSAAESHLHKKSLFGNTG